MKRLQLLQLRQVALASASTSITSGRSAFGALTGISANISSIRRIIVGQSNANVARLLSSSSPSSSSSSPSPSALPTSDSTSTLVSGFSSSSDNRSNNDNINSIRHNIIENEDVQSAAFFTGNPHYYTFLLRINAVIRQHGLPLRDASIYRAKSLPQWMTKDEMSELKQFRLTHMMYNDLVHKLNVLFTIRDKPESLLLLLQDFVRPGQTLSSAQKLLPTLDKFGRAFARGSRKTAKSQVWIVKGTGQIFVNGIHLSQYFTEMRDREAVVRPFEAANQLGQFNVWAVVSGGGRTGQAEAVAVAVSRALTIHVPELRSQFDSVGLTKIDRRQVERKKTGQPKARKKNTWLKR